MVRRVVIVGSGKVGAALARALAEKNVAVTLLSARSPGWASLRGDLLVIAARDAAIAGVARTLARAPRLPKAVVHCAGALDSSPLAALAERGLAVGTMHPALSFPARESAVDFRGAALVITGDPLAIAFATSVAQLLKMRPVAVAALDRIQYHAACALLANGAVALAFAAGRLLFAAGVDERSTPQLLAALLASVARNIAALGPEAALSGPVRRAELSTIEAHIAAADRHDPATGRLLRAVIAGQADIVERLGEVPAEGFAQLRALIEAR